MSRVGDLAPRPESVEGKERMFSRATARRLANAEREGSYVPTIADRMLAEADRFGVSYASAVDDAQPLDAALLVESPPTGSPGSRAPRGPMRTSG